MPAAIQLRGVSKSYGKVRALQNLDLDIPAGGVYGLLGPNGSGKTTTLRMITGILLPDAGRIEIFGHAAGRASRDLLGYLPEERGLYPKMKLREQLVFFARLKSVPRAEAERRAGYWLERLELQDWGGRRLNELSKGMQQKAQFAVSLLGEPRVLILDEMTSGLDPVNAELVRQILLEQRAAGKTILFSTHRMEDAERLCDSICLIARGRKLLDGDINEVRARAGRQTARLDFRGDAGLLQQAPGVLQADLYGNYAELRLAQPDQAPALLRWLAPRLEITRFELLQPTLNQIFLETVARGGETAEPHPGEAAAAGSEATHA